MTQGAELGVGGIPPHPLSDRDDSSSTNQGVSRDLQLTDSCCYWLPMTSCQRGTFDHHDQLAARFVQGLRTSLAQMLQDPSIADGDRVYLHLASDRLRHAYDGWGLIAGEWRRDEGRVARLLENLRRTPFISRARLASNSSPHGWTTWQKRPDVP